MQAALNALLSQQSPSLQTRKALILLGLQNDFVLPDGKLPVKDTGYLDPIADLVTSFREFGDVIWVRTEYQADRPVDGLKTPGDTVVVSGTDGNDDGPSSPRRSPEGNKRTSPASSKRFKSSSPKSSASFSRPDSGEDDEELFLTRTPTREPCCVRGSRGAEFTDRVKSMIMSKQDLQVTKSHYSAFGATSLLLTLRSKLITELFVCGNMTNLSVYATAVDAARYGIKITLVEDCLGYRSQARHDFAVKQLHEMMEADIKSSERVVDSLRNPHVSNEYSNHSGDDSKDSQEESEYEDTTGPDRKSSDKHVQAASLEVDSDESGEEMNVPNVGRTILESRTRFSSAVGACSLNVANPHFATSQSSRPSDCVHGNVKDRKTSQRNIRRQKDNHVKPKLVTSSRHDQRRLGLLDSPDSSEHSRQPWLDLLPSTSTSTLQTVLRPKHPGLAALASVGGFDARANAQYEAMMAATQEKNANAARSKPLFGDDKEEESGGSRILYDLLDAEAVDGIFEKLSSEINWQSMYHQTGEVPRLVCCQGTMGDDNSMPVYRHPSDQTIPLEKWTPVVDKVRKAAEKAVGHPLNHALIQLYRSGNDYISEHSDKTLDIVASSNIVNVSFGAQRVMRLRTKRAAGQNVGGTRTTHRIPMPHNSMLIMSLPTNAKYLHGINWDRRPPNELIEAETVFGGQRISLTFRHIGTYLNSDSSKIWGQGAVGKVRDQARRVINGDPVESDRLIKAFGKENQASSIVWEEIYGRGFDVLHLK